MSGSIRVSSAAQLQKKALRMMPCIVALRPTSALIVGIATDRAMRSIRLTTTRMKMTPKICQRTVVRGATMELSRVRLLVTCLIPCSFGL